VEATGLNWLWPGWILGETLALISANAGVGKTRFVADLIRRVRHGEGWPDGTAMSLPADTGFIIVAADVADVLAAGAFCPGLRQSTPAGRAGGPGHAPVTHLALAWNPDCFLFDRLGPGLIKAVRLGPMLFSDPE
jgi:hypothetical protein